MMILSFPPVFFIRSNKLIDFHEIEITQLCLLKTILFIDYIVCTFIRNKSKIELFRSSITIIHTVLYVPNTIHDLAYL
ncbi:MAG: hypothetical protein ACI8RD_014567 [Bacillariaceae sp.]|jgi:hypothetical protein